MSSVPKVSVHGGALEEQQLTNRGAVEEGGGLLGRGCAGASEESDQLLGKEACP
jgi:hypothetical protein